MMMSTGFPSMYRAMLAVSLCAVLPSTFDAAAALQPALGSRIDGSNLSRVDFAGGRFEQGDGYWTEYGTDGRPRFRFEETSRDEWSVYLIDRSRNVALQLDAFRRMVTLFENGRLVRDLYPITDANASRDNDHDPRGSDYADKPGADQGPERGDRPALGGFYRQRSGAAVMFQFAETLHCVVQNPSQMGVFGGFDRVLVVGHLAMEGNSTGVCGWPNGFYRRSNEPHVYRLYGPGALGLGRRACHVTDPRQMTLFGGFAQVQVVEPSSNLFQGREQPAECADHG
jgi:hypothetical protein